MRTMLIIAQTLDGKIARNADECIDWTGKADKKMFMELTKRAGVIIMGARTYDTIGKPLPGRKNIVLTRNPEKTGNHPDLVFTRKTPKALLKDLEKEGYTEAAVVGGEQINTLFAEDGLIDEFIITVAPKIFGRGLSLFNASLDIDLTLESSTILENEYLLLRYTKKKDSSSVTLLRICE
ncbi:MAG: dihydrofolate reductase [Desulfobacterales bacterium]|nr:MAG: dihydrofolate reductase [Desulfobacterales bacterium]